MLRFGLVLAVCGAVAGCATTQNTAEAQQECVAEVEESTGSRLETNKVCTPAPGN
jgi:hypothetical protein